jgi:hypothetical protein
MCEGFDSYVPSDKPLLTVFPPGEGTARAAEALGLGQRIGFTGTSQGMTMAQWGALYLALERVRGTLLHGDCVGADAQAHMVARGRGLRIEVYPPTNGKARANMAGDVVHPAAPYLKRNRAIVDSCDVLYAAPYSLVERLRSGTWATVRYARSCGKRVIILPPNP